MKFRITLFWFLSLIFNDGIFSLYAIDGSIKPVTPNSSKETRELLKFLYNISGKYTLTGQHNYPNVKDRNSQFASDYIGKTPVIFSTDWGFAKPGDTDSYLARPDIVKEVIRQHQLGSIITICWHAVPPTADEPITFRPPSGGNAPDSLVSVQGQLLDEQFRDVLTPGTRFYKHWCTQVDTIAFYLKKLQDAHVPILWRPYHEMNGNWFWWGGRVGEYSTAALYRQLYDRLVNYHKLNNLIWVWSIDRPVKPEMQFSNFFPGIKYVDILALDVYRNDFNQTYYDSLVSLSNGKPVVLGEVGNPPASEILKNQPKWTYYVTWAGMVRNTSKKQYNEIISDPHFLFREDSVYCKAIDAYRVECGMPLLQYKEIKQVLKKSDFSGEWVFNEEKSTLDNSGVSYLPYKLTIIQNGNDLITKKTFILEYADDKIVDEKLTLDGKECASEMFNSPRIMTTKWSENQDTLFIDSKVIFNRGGQSSEMVLNEAWSLQEKCKILSINQYSNSFWGERRIIMVYEKQ